jgi:hypothetical protein
MSHLAIILLVVGAFVLVPGMIMAVRTHLENRAEELAPFRNYFGAEYDRDLLRQSSWCDGEYASDRRNRFDAVNVGDSGATARFSKGGGTIRWNRGRD